MFDIQELDDLVCQLLNPHDLAQCAQVSKKWHSVVIPHLWRDLTWLERVRHKRREAFRLMVLEDYLEEQQRQKPQGEGQTPPYTLLSTLSKYGHWIRLLPDPYYLQMIFNSYPARQIDPTASELLLHLMERSPDDVQLEFFEVFTGNLDPAADDTQRMILDIMLPHVRHLYFRDAMPVSHANVSRAKILLNQCSAALRKLALSVDTSADTSGMPEFEEEPAESASKSWTSFKELVLCKWTDNTDVRTFWSWLFMRCGHVQKLEVRAIHGTARVLAQAMLDHMPQLTEISLGPETIGFVRVTADNIATLLSGSTKGWRRVTLGPKSDAGRVVMDALEKHFPTLETLELRACRDFWCKNTVHVLRSCPHLRSFMNFDPYSKLDINVFIDRDSDTGSLTPWESEQSLKVLRLNITGIPRMDSPEYFFEEIAWSGQRCEIQDGFYDRLARLTHLETLWLRERDDEDTFEFLEMSLETGLHKLSGLKRLRELHFNGMSTEIGVKEVQWMVENWPRLRVIDGLDVNGDNREAAQWLRENRPQIVM